MASPRWSPSGRALAHRITKIWPGPDESVGTTPPTPRWLMMNQILASIPAGRWTSYSDIAEVIGSHQVAVGTRLAAIQVPNAHRVLKLHGAISPEFRWPERTCLNVYSAPMRCAVSTRAESSTVPP